MGRKDKLEGGVPQEFLVDAQLIKETRDYTIDVNKYLEKMVKTAIPPGATVNAAPTEEKAPAVRHDEFQKLARTCENSMNYFYEQRYYYVLKTTSNVCTRLSEKHKSMIQQIHDRTMFPIKVWLEEDYPQFIRDLQKCAKLKKETDSIVKDAGPKPTPIKEAKVQTAKELFDQQLKACKIEVEKNRKRRKHHTTCFKLMAVMHYNYSKSVLDEIEKAQTELAGHFAETDVKQKEPKKA